MKGPKRAKAAPLAARRAYPRPALDDRRRARSRGTGFDDSIITDTAAEKLQDMAEMAAELMTPAKYRAKWYRGRNESHRTNGVPFPAAMA